MNIDRSLEVAAALARRFEGFYSKPYLCPAGVPTIGYGATYYEDGRAVTLRDAPISKERADALLLWMVRTRYLPQVIRLCPEIDTPERLAAIIDFTFNLGSGALRASTLRRRINAGHWDSVPTELRKWVKGGGRVLAGLVKRREAEIQLVCSPHHWPTHRGRGAQPTRPRPDAAGSRRADAGSRAHHRHTAGPGARRR